MGALGREAEGSAFGIACCLTARDGSAPCLVGAVLNLGEACDDGDDETGGEEHCNVHGMKFPFLGVNRTD